MKKFFTFLANTVTTFPKTIIAIVFILTVVFATFIPRLTIDNNVLHWINPDGEAGILPNYINKRFGQTNPVLILAEFKNPFTIESLSTLQNITKDLEERLDVETVLSLANIEDIRSSNNELVIQKLIPKNIAKSNESLNELKSYILSESTYVERLVSKEGSTFSFIIKTKNNIKVDDAAKNIRDFLHTKYESSTLTFYYAGIPSLMNSISEIVLSDLAFLVPLVILIVIIILYLSFKNLRGIILPLITVCIAAIITMGTLSLLNIPLTVMTAVVPVIIIAIGSAYGIHVMNDYYEEVLIITDKKKLVKSTLQNVGIPVIMAGLTTIFGFLSLSTADNTLIRDFGFVAAFGVIVSMFLSVTFIPSCLCLLKAKESKGISKEDHITKPGKIALAFSHFVYEKKLLVITGFIVVFILSIILSFQVKSRVDYLSYFNASSAPQKAAQIVNERFGGYNPSQLYLKADALDPIVLKCLLIAEEYAKSWPNTQPATGFPDIMVRLNKAMTGFNTLPETKEEAESLYFFVEGKKELKSFISDDKKEMLSTYMLSTLDSDYYSGMNSHNKEWIDGFKKEINAGYLTIDSKEFLSIAELFLSNYIESLNLKDTKDISSSLILANKNLNNSFYAINTDFIEAYLKSEESELLFSDRIKREIALKLHDNFTQIPLSEIENNPIIDLNKSTNIISTIINNIINKNSLTASQDDVLSLSETLAYKIKNDFKKQRLNIIKNVIINNLAINDNDDLSYALSVYTWELFPVQNSYTGKIIKTLPVEQFEQTGLSALMESIRQGLLGSQVLSLIIALTAIMILNFFTFKSFKSAIVSLSAIIFTIFCNFGLMGLLGINLDMITIAIASIAIGTGIDFTIHFIVRFTYELKRLKNDFKNAYACTLSTVGKAIVFNAISVGLGFCVLFFSQVMPLRTLGLLLGFTMFTASFSACTLLPAVLILVNQKKGVSI